MPSRIRVILADDHPVVLMGIRGVLDRAGDVDVVGAVTTITDLYEILQRTVCDVLICDYAFRGDKEPDGMQMLKRLVQSHPKIRILLVSMCDSSATVRQIMRLGVSGFCSKHSEAIGLLPEALRALMAGRQYIDPQTTHTLVQQLCRSGDPSGQVPLSPREMEVARLLVRGMRLCDIAAQTQRSQKTVSAQKKSAMLKLGVTSILELAQAVGEFD